MICVSNAMRHLGDECLHVSLLVMSTGIQPYKHTLAGPPALVLPGQERDEQSGAAGAGLPNSEGSEIQSIMLDASAADTGSDTDAIQKHCMSAFICTLVSSI